MHFTQHALPRMAERGVTQGDVNWALQQPDSTEMRDGGLRIVRRRAPGQGNRLFVITNLARTVVISAWWR